MRTLHDCSGGVATIRARVWATLRYDVRVAPARCREAGLGGGAGAVLRC